MNKRELQTLNIRHSFYKTDSIPMFIGTMRRITCRLLSFSEDKQKSCTQNGLPNKKFICLTKGS